MRMHAVCFVEVAASVKRTFAVAVDNATLEAVVQPYGPIPGVVKSEILDGGPPRTGAVRRVTLSDGAVVDETLDAITPPQGDQPGRHAYTAQGGIKFPLSLFVRGFHNEWRYTRMVEDPGRCRVEWNFGVDLTSPLAWPIAAWLLKPLLKGMMRQALRGLAARVEAAAPSTGADVAGHGE